MPNEVGKRIELFLLLVWIGLLAFLGTFLHALTNYWSCSDLLAQYWLHMTFQICIIEKPDFPDFLQILFLLSFFLSTSLRRAILVLPEPFELVSSQFFSAWVEDVQRQGQKKKEDIFCWWISWLWQPWLCGLTPFKLLLRWYAWIQLSIVTMMQACKLLLQIDYLHKKGARNQCNFTANYSII